MYRQRGRLKFEFQAARYNPLYTDLRHFIGEEGVAKRFSVPVHFNHRKNVRFKANTSDLTRKTTIVSVMHHQLRDMKGYTARIVEPDGNAPSWERNWFDGQVGELENRIKSAEAMIEGFSGL